MASNSSFILLLSVYILVALLAMVSTAATFERFGNFKSCEKAFVNVSTNSNADNTYNISTETLNDIGREQAKKLAKELSNKNITKIVSSSLPRAKETTQIIAEILNITDVEYWDELQEARIGEMQGAQKPISKKTGIGMNSIELLSAGLGEESFNDFYNRAKKSTKKGDDLKKINGIGPAFEKRLNAMGIFTYADMAAITVESAEKLEEKHGDAMTSPEEWMNWANEAKELMK